MLVKFNIIESKNISKIEINKINIQSLILVKSLFLVYKLNSNWKVSMFDFLYVDSCYVYRHVLLRRIILNKVLILFPFYFICLNFEIKFAIKMNILKSNS